ncbi:MAG TPA: hypothetical protein VHY84_02850 [Bryobacteraceae bacterium]|jgi:hypothetical protein|nr:hypothetical protein [Bryobacteraceae bacterium]
MPFATIRKALCPAALGCVFAFTVFAQQQVTVEKLVEFITSSVSQKMQDKDVAGVLVNMKLTEKLDMRTVENLQGNGAGPKTVAALTRLAEASASLHPPPPKVEAAKPKPIPPPSYDEQQKVIEEARSYALNYSKTLPDFICLQVTRRYIDPHYKPGAEGYWAVSDRLAEKLSYFDQHEKYEAISHNDTSLFGKNADSVGGALSRGDFGTLLREIFEPESDAEFHWERWGNLSGHLFHVYTYAIDQPHSKETIDYDRGAQKVTPGYHGEIFVEKGPNVIWRITVEPDPPASFPIQNIHQVLDYRYTDISGQKFLLPLNGTIIMRADGVGTKNEIDFRSYRKYSADTSITFDDSDDKSDTDQKK